MHRWLTALCGALQRLLFPDRCLACGAPVRSSGQTDDPAGTAVASGMLYRWQMGPFFCSTCRQGYTPIESPICPVCGVMFQSRTGADHLCGACMGKVRPFRRARACGVYERSLKTAIHCFKYEGRLQLAHPLSRLMADCFRRCWQPDSIDVLIPVPLHMRRFRDRGFNPAYLLVSQWAGRNHGLPIATRALFRDRPTRPQTGLGRRDRQKNMKNAFRLSADPKVADQRVLLVDDVMTTGATAEECARVLVRGGARYVDVLTLARTL